MKSVKYVRDPIFGNIELSETEARILETNEMQRLRRIKQLGNAYLVYPGATHSRFQHSLGTMEATKRLSRRLFGEEVEALSLVGMLHDIGHAPLSHTLDSQYEQHLGKNHEQIGLDMIFGSEIWDIISGSGVSKREFADLFSGKERGKIVTGALGSDRVDYLSRDAYYTGVALGIIDFNRIIGKTGLYKNSPAVEQGGIVGAESLLIARYFMFSSVYTHHAVEIANLMASKAASMAIDDGAIAPKELHRISDQELEGLIIGSSGRKLQERINYRKLYKRAVYSDLKEGSEAGRDEIESALSKSGLEYEDYVVTVISYKPGGDISVVAEDGKHIGSLGELSPLINTLNRVMEAKKTLLVACDEKNIGKVKRVIGKIL
jgi:hypothetical protein